MYFMYFTYLIYRKKYEQRKISLYDIHNLANLTNFLYNYTFHQFSETFSINSFFIISIRIISINFNL